MTAADRARKKRILEVLRGKTLEEAAADPKVRPDLDAEAASDEADRIVTRDLLAVADAVRATRRTGPSLSLFFSTDDVIIVPGFMGSELIDTEGPNGLIWIDPTMILGADELLALKLKGDIDDDEMGGVVIRAGGAIPLLYGGLKYDLEVRRYDVRIYGFDWRKHVDASAVPLANLIRDRANRSPRRLHIIAHSQGSLVARRAIQLVGPELARRLVNNLVLLGPATAGTFSAAVAVAGTHTMIETVRRYGIRPPDGFDAVLQSMSGLYQLLPWRTDSVNGTTPDKAIEWVQKHFPEERPTDERVAWYRDPATWETGVDAGRLSGLYGWGRTIDTSFLNDRTTIILGDAPTVGGVKFRNNKLVADDDFVTSGDGTVPDSLARVEGVNRVFKAQGTEHMMLPATWAVIVAVRDVLAGRLPQVAPFAAAGGNPNAPPFLVAPPLPTGPVVVPAAVPVAAAGAPVGPPINLFPTPTPIADVSPPTSRRLRVFSFDPLFAADLDNLGVEQITIELPWEFADGDRLQPGPVGEYLEVVDFDATSRCFYPPVDLNHPHLLAQDGIPVSEGEPRFHQQMVYAVAMNTIRHFEIALGRAALWSPNLRRDQFGTVLPSARPADDYVQRLRIYPHAMREANAYYHPGPKALLFGYFSADAPNIGRNLPGGTVFACLSYDIVAHETTHALLDGLHRYFIQPSNPDVFAFHEAFADIVALLQHFSHPEVLRHQIAKTRGDLGGESSLGMLAAQFGEATGERGALREYLGRKGADGKWEPVTPDPKAIRTTTESHRRGAILVAALFRAFQNIYESRVRDLRRIATGGTGILPEGDLHPDMVNRLAEEAAKAAKHLLRMCARALDYVPPVDLTFGEYLRALVTADYDLVRDDDRRYRVGIISAFRDWGIYPSDVRSLSVDSLLWCPPEREAVARLREVFADLRVDQWTLTADRREAYLTMLRHNAALHDWLANEKNLSPDLAWVLGLNLDPKDAPGGIRRKNGKPIFQVHTCRPCRRIGPDGQQLTDVVVSVLQRRKGFFDPAMQAEVDAMIGDKWSEPTFDATQPDFYFRGGCTLVIDPASGAIRYCVRKAITANGRLEAERNYRQGKLATTAAAFLDPADDANPFAILHAHK